jgi:hypothetical protein
MPMESASDKGLDFASVSNDTMRQTLSPLAIGIRRLEQRKYGAVQTPDALLIFSIWRRSLSSLTVDNIHFYICDS